MEPFSRDGLDPGRGNKRIGPAPSRGKSLLKGGIHEDEFPSQRDEFLLASRRVVEGTSNTEYFKKLSLYRSGSL